MRRGLGLQGPQGGGKGAPEPLDWSSEGETSCCDTLPSLEMGLCRGFFGDCSDDPPNHCPPVFPSGLFAPSSLRRSQAVALFVDRSRPFLCGWTSVHTGRIHPLS